MTVVPLFLSSYTIYKISSVIVFRRHRLAGTIIKIYSLITHSRFPLDSKFHLFTLSVRQNVIQIESYQSISPAQLRVTVRMMTKLYLVWILRIYMSYQIDRVRFYIPPKGAETQRQIAILYNRHPITHNIYCIMPILGIILLWSSQTRYRFLRQNTVYPVDVDHCSILIIFTVGHRIVDQCTNLFIPKRFLTDIARSQCCLIIQLNKASHLLKGMMRELCDRGGAIFFSTHVLEVAEKLCDKVAIIKGGRLIRSGTMEEVKGDDSLEQVFLELEDEA